MNPYHIALTVLFEPMYAFPLIKRDRRRFSHLVNFALLFLVVAVRVASILITHYPISAVDPQQTNIGREVLNMIVPILTWSVGCYLVTTIHSGESLSREVLQGVAFAMLPYILLTLPIALVSNLFSRTDVALLSVTFIDLATGFVWAWVIVLQLIALGQMNSYGFLETLGVALVSLFTCVFLWAVLVLVYVLGSNVTDFLFTVFEEYRLFFFGA